MFMNFTINRYKKVNIAPIALLLLGTGLPTFTHAVTYAELNAQREDAGLPNLTGDDNIDYRILSQECSEGIEYSCVLGNTLAEKYQSGRVYEKMPPQYVPVPQSDHQYYTPYGGYDLTGNVPSLGFEADAEASRMRTLNREMQEMRDNNMQNMKNEHNRRCQQEYDARIARGEDSMSATTAYSHCVQY